MISQIGLQNVLAFRDLALPTRRLTLLSGTNSAGKSSLLHALALLRQSHLAGTLPESLLLNGELVELGTGRDLLHSEPQELEGDGALSIAIEDELGLTEWTAGYDAAADVIPLVDVSGNGGNEHLFGVGFQYLRADRIVPAVTYPKSHEAVSVQHFLGGRGEHAPNYLRVHGHEPLNCRPAAHPDAASGSVADQTNAWLNVLSPGTSLMVLDVEGTDYVRLAFRRAGPEVRTEQQRATNVGFGLTYALPIIVACVTATPGALVLVENPEAHLHPHGQAAMGRLCALAASGGTQVVLETHSDHVLNAIRLAVKRGELDANETILHFFTREAGVLQPGVVTLEVQPDGMLPAWPPGFFDEWDRALDELLE